MTCPKCGGLMKAVAFLTDHVVVGSGFPQKIKSLPDGRVALELEKISFSESDQFTEEGTALIVKYKKAEAR